MTKVFICHASKDKAFVRRLASDLSALGLDVWVDETAIRVGDSLLDRIEAGLRESDYVIVVLSKRSLKRPWVQRELRAALQLEVQRRKRIILPLIRGKVSVPLFLSDSKYADFSRNYQRGLGELSRVFEEHRSPLLQQLKTLRCRVDLHILRLDGSRVRHVKTQRVQAQEPGVERYVEALSGDGETSGYAIQPGRIERVRRESGLTYVETLFPTPLKRRESATRVFSCLFSDSFTGGEEYWDQRQYHPSRNVEVLVHFLKSRPPLEWHAVEKRGPDEIPIADMLEVRRRRGRVTLRLFVRRPRLLSSYVVRWRW